MGKRLMNPNFTRTSSQSLFNPDLLLTAFQTYARDPFTELLAEMVQCAPTSAALQVFANDHPDRWANAIRTIARLAGYHDKLEIKKNITVDIQNMGDAQLMHQIKQVRKELAALGIDDVEDISFEMVKDEEEEREEPVDISSLLGEVS